MKQINLYKQNCSNKIKCEGNCGKYFEENDLDMENGRFLCRECENKD
jgi:formylmethanofuran dehydrogenase subunit E